MFTKSPASLGLAALTLSFAAAAATAACSDLEAPATEPSYRADLSEVVVPDPAECIDPRDHGATLDDGTDDRLGLQAAIDLAKATGKPVCLAPGRFDIGVDPAAGSGHIESLKIWNTDGFTMVGAGRRSVLAFLGTGIRKVENNWMPGDWWLLGVRGARDTYLAHFLVDGSARYHTEEQTHAIQLTHLQAGWDGNATALSTSNTQLDHVDFNDPAPTIPAGLQACRQPGDTDATMCLHPAFPDGKGLTTPLACKYVVPTARCTIAADGTRTVVGFYGGGDCVRLFAEEQTMGVRVIDTTVEGSHAICDRSFVALQRGTDGYRVIDNTVDAVGDAAIDEEPTGGGPTGGSVYRAYISGNVFHRGGGRKAGILISMSGTASAPFESTENVITANVVDGSITGYNTSNTVISFNTIRVAEGNTAPIYLMKYGAGNRIIGNTIVREAKAAPGTGITISAHNSGFPSDVLISDNVIRLLVDGNAIVAEPGVGVLVSNNVIESQALTGNTWSAFFTRGTHAENDPSTTADDVTTGAERITFTGNQVRGTFRRMIHEGQFTVPAVPAGTDGKGNPYPARPAVPIPNHATVVTDNIFEPATTGVTIYGVNFDNGCPTPAPVIDANIFRGLAASQHVVGACGTTGWIGTNSGP